MSAKTPKYKVGDKVKLIVGGPIMAVSEVIMSGYGSQEQFNGRYRCQWFAGKKLDSGVFEEENLETSIESGEPSTKK
ncbi:MULTISPECIES: DUF2158 domain-containing protein [Acinetobacter]|uniref:DUF2158 domain-containing protein n=1 Tax=Acinetobacter TaxID=469 RepID=UPI000D655F9E|nr:MULTISPECIES: DUF2158 domain-containing protein [Acinetobacter]KAB1612527.1 DUF2158 domain-containing protein [Acinetobacter baumannii]UNI12155.1 DUF2158 domain-containing protein [Acinetobacter baumannii]